MTPKYFFFSNTTLYNKLRLFHGLRCELMPCDIDLISQTSPYAVFKVPLLISLPPTLPHPSVCHAACSPCGEQRANVGLNLKFNKKNEEVPGYTKRTEREWLYSLAVEELLAEYVERLNRTDLLYLLLVHLLLRQK